MPTKDDEIRYDLVGKLIVDFAHIEKGVYSVVCALAGTATFHRQIVDALTAASDGLSIHTRNLKKLIPVLDVNSEFKAQIEEVIGLVENVKVHRNQLSHGLLVEVDKGVLSFLAKGGDYRIVEINNEILEGWVREGEIARQKVKAPRQTGIG